jgi:hypothetical protein
MHPLSIAGAPLASEDQIGFAQPSGVASKKRLRLSPWGPGYMREEVLKE